MEVRGPRLVRPWETRGSRRGTPPAGPRYRTPGLDPTSTWGMDVWWILGHPKPPRRYPRAMQNTAPARRVETMDDLERAGDYCLDRVLVKGVETPQVWFLLPIHEGGSIFERVTEGSGLHGISSPPWTFRECPDGSLEIRASILCGRSPERPDGYFHGFLDEGNVWRWS